MSEKLYKILAHGQKSCHGGNHIWIPGEWLTIEGELVPCKNGIHLCRPEHLLDWLHEEIWEAEYTGEIIDAGDKLVVRSARIVKRCENWNECTARLYACDCAQEVAYLNPDSRFQTAIEVARRHANGLATVEGLAEAWAAAGAAAEEAVRAAVRAWAKEPARAAAKAEARADAGVAAKATAMTAAWVAAKAAARAAAEAWAAAAARAAAEVEARVAAWAAAREKQTKRLIDYLFAQ